MWYPDGDGFDEIKAWEKEERLNIRFDITHTESLPAPADEVVHCLACLNVDENSEPADGDEGFAACYKTTTGDSKDANGKYQYEPAWVFLNQVKVTNKGNNIAKNGESGWESTFKWNKYKDPCGTNFALEGEYWLTDTYLKIWVQKYWSKRWRKSLKVLLYNRQLNGNCKNICQGLDP